MSRAEEFKRLMEHAANRLREDEPNVRRAFDSWRKHPTSGYDGGQALTALLSYTTTVTYTTLLLDLVAAFLIDDEEPPTSTEVTRAARAGGGE